MSVVVVVEGIAEGVLLPLPVELVASAITANDHREGSRATAAHIIIVQMYRTTNEMEEVCFIILTNCLSS